MDKAKKILIVDDDLYIREVYEEILTSEGFDVSTATDGQEGFQKASAGGYSLILLDVMMPKMDGLQVLKSLAANPPQHPNGPIVLLTNLARDPIIEDALQLGAKQYMIKSDLNPDMLVAKIRQFLA